MTTQIESPAKLELMSKSHRLYSRIERDLKSNAFKKGDKFYSISQLVEKFEVSPGTAQKVLQEFSKSGHLVSVKGKGYFVDADFEQNITYKSETPAKHKTICYVMTGETVHSQTAALLACISSFCSRNQWRFEITSASLIDLRSLASRDDLIGVFVEPNIFIPDSYGIKVPVICTSHYLGQPDDNVVCVTTDAEQAGEMLVRSLYSMGHRKIGVLGVDGFDGKINPVFFDLFKSGLKRGCDKYKLSWENVHFAISEDNESGDFICRSIEQFKKDNVAAIFALSWATVLEAINSSLKLGFSIPDDFSLIGYGASDATPNIRPKVSRFSLDTKDTIGECMRIISEFVEGKKMPSEKNIYLPVELLFGETLGPAPYVGR